MTVAANSCLVNFLYSADSIFQLRWRKFNTHHFQFLILLEYIKMRMNLADQRMLKCKTRCVLAWHFTDYWAHVSVTTMNTQLRIVSSLSKYCLRVCEETSQHNQRKLWTKSKHYQNQSTSLQWKRKCCSSGQTPKLLKNLWRCALQTNSTCSTMDLHLRQVCLTTATYLAQHPKTSSHDTGRWKVSAWRESGAGLVQTDANHPQS